MKSLAGCWKCAPVHPPPAPYEFVPPSTRTIPVRTQTGEKQPPRDDSLAKALPAAVVLSPPRRVKSAKNLQSLEAQSTWRCFAVLSMTRAPLAHTDLVELVPPLAVEQLAAVVRFHAGSETMLAGTRYPADPSRMMHTVYLSRSLRPIANL
jgi:hypothetical protein